MSSTIVCRNFMSSFDPQETTTTLKLKVLNKNPEFQEYYYQDQKDITCKNSFNNNMTVMSNTTKPYNSYTRLSPQSLELCTENLGSETGTDTIFTTTINMNDQEPSNQSLVPQNSTTSTESITTSKLQKSHFERDVKKTKIISFPPPLTTMSGSSPLQVMRHRENGRLIIEAVERPSRNGVLQAERTGGRLRLCFLNSSEEGGDEELAAEDGGDEVVEEMNQEHEVLVGDNHEVLEKDVDEVNKYQWMSRCKEGGGHGGNNRSDHDSNWNKPALWVVTS